MMRNVVHQDDGSVKLGPPIAVFAFRLEEATFFSNPDLDFIVRDDGEFRSVVSQTRPASVPKPFQAEITRYMGRGSIPEFDPTLHDESNTTRRHEFLEIAARGVSYAEVRDPESPYQRGTILEGGYVVTGLHVDEESNGGFAAAEVHPLTIGGTPIMAFRGSEKRDLVTADLEIRGIGYDQFSSNRDWVVDWVEEYGERYELSPTFVGHSLGGALAQWFVTAVMQDTEMGLEEVVTFNSPGIGAADVAAVDADTRSRVDQLTHYVVSGDFVSLAGERFIEANNTEVVLVNVTNQLILFVKDLLDPTKTSLPRHTHPILTDSLSYKDGTMVPLLEGQEHVLISLQQLNHPEFNYMHDGEYRDFVFKTYTEVGQSSQHFVARQRTEEFRKRLFSSDPATQGEFSFALELILGLTLSKGGIGTLTAIYRKNWKSGRVFEAGLRHCQFSTVEFVARWNRIHFI